MGLSSGEDCMIA